MFKFVLIQNMHHRNALTRVVFFFFGYNHSTFFNPVLDNNNKFSWKKENEVL